MPAITRDLNVLARCGNQFRSSRLTDLQLTTAQSPYILHICARPGMSQEQARALHVNPSSAGSSAWNSRDIIPASPARRTALMSLHPRIRHSSRAAVRCVNQQWHDYLTQGGPGGIDPVGGLLSACASGRRLVIGEDAAR